MIRMNVHCVYAAGRDAPVFGSGSTAGSQGSRYLLPYNQMGDDHDDGDDDGGCGELLAVTLHETITVCLLYYLGHAIQLFSSGLADESRRRTTDGQRHLH